MTSTDITVEIPADVRDNSETITDYAFMRHRSPGNGITPRLVRDTAIVQTGRFGYTHYDWWDKNPDGQRCHFDLITNSSDQVVHLFHTEFFTRVPCAECEHSYASVYQLLTEKIDDEILDAVPRCDQHADSFRKLCAREGTPLIESEFLRVGQH